MQLISGSQVMQHDSGLPKTQAEYLKQLNTQPSNIVHIHNVRLWLLISKCNRILHLQIKGSTGHKQFVCPSYKA